MNKWFRLLIILAIILFLTANIVLIDRDKSKVSRINYITDWSQIKKTDIIHSMPVDGVIAQAENHYIMVDGQTAVEEFLVQEGDTVETGTPLFTYKSDKIDQQMAILDAEIESLQAKKSSIQALIDELKSMTPPISSPPANTDGLDPLYQPEAERARWQQAIDQQAGEKRLEMGKVDADIKKIEKQKEQLQSGKNNLTVTSPIAGIVKEIAPDSKKIMTIASDDTVLKGKLDEEQLSQVNEGMKVNILSHLFEGRLTGEINQIVKLPVDNPDNKNKSLYPFTVLFEEEDKEVHIGYHVTADIILEEANDVPAVLGKSIRHEDENSFIWVLNEKGMAQKRHITTGLEVGNLYAITNGAQEGEFYVTDQREAVKQAPFITPLDFYKLEKTARKDITRKQALKHFLIGVLQR